MHRIVPKWSYFFVFAGGGGGGVAFAGAATAGAACCCAGADIGAVAEVFTFCNNPLSDSTAPDFKNTVDVMAKMAINAAKIQVPFSRTSVVCLTPIKLLDMPPTFAFNPPPLGF
jgi:hypothetical protein